MNFVMIAGHLGSDPETRFTPSGQKVTSFRMAVNIRKGGKDETVWYRITIWGDRFEKMMPYLKKGSGVIVTGELGKPEIYTDREGKQQVSLDITAENLRFSPFGKGSGGDQAQGSRTQPSQGSAYGESVYTASAGSQSYSGAGSYTTGSFSGDDSEDALPF